VDLRRLFQQVQKSWLLRGLEIIATVSAVSFLLIAVLPPNWAIVSVAVVVMGVVFVLSSAFVDTQQPTFASPSPQHQPQAQQIPQPQKYVNQLIHSLRQPEVERIQDLIRRRFNGCGEQAVVDFFSSRLQSGDALDRAYREVFADMQNDPQFGALARGVDEFVKIGYSRLSKTHPRGGYDHTKNQLYGALYRSLANLDLEVPGGKKWPTPLARK
jgi:hypothetical protein